MNNPSLRQEARYEPAAVIPLKQEDSIIEWLKASGRLIAREIQEKDIVLDEDEEISELMDVDDGDYDDEEPLMEDLD
jgi:hypothetical protein